MPLVYLIDERMTQAHAILASIPKVDLGFVITPYMSVLEIVLAVNEGLEGAPPPPAKSHHRTAQEKTTAAMITAIRIMAHGNSEMLHLGQGIDERNAVQLQPLGAAMLAGANAECLLLGCNVAMSTPRSERFLGGAAIGQRFGSPLHGWASDDLGLRERSGYRLLHAIARTLGVPTTAGLDTQTLTYDAHFIGATMTVDPLGKVTYTGVDTPGSFVTDLR